MTETQTNRITEIQKDKRTKRKEMERKRDGKRNGRLSGSDESVLVEGDGGDGIPMKQMQMEGD